MRLFARLVQQIHELDRPEMFLTDLEWKIGDAIIHNNSLADNVPLVQVRTELAQPTQYLVHQDKVDALAQEGKVDGSISIQRFGKCWILDGHHRTRAAEQLNKNTIWMHVIVLPDEPVSLGEFAMILAVPESDIEKEFFGEK
jgi:hypothetical protein